MPFGPRGRVVAKPSLVLPLTLGFLGLVSCQSPTPEDLQRAATPIVDGKLDTAHKGVVSLLKAVQGGYFPSCTGTLIAPNLVLTAHHCVAALSSPDGASVDCATTEFTRVDSPASMLVSVEANVGAEGLTPYGVSQVWVPPGDSAVCGRDVALLLLSGSGIPGSRATPIEPSIDAELKASETFSAIGYGLQSPTDQTGETAGHRMIVTTGQVFCQGDACGSDKVLEGEFIADSPVCSGDSGGPALANDGRVSGVTSRGDDKCSLGIYSNVAAWQDFIVEKARVAATSGGYATPEWAGGDMAGTGGTTSVGGTANGGSSSTGGTSLVVAGSPSQPAVGGSGNTPIVDPLGLSCTGQCPGAYVCWAATGEPPGICVPQCSAAQTTCPEGFVCDSDLSACIRAIEPKPKNEDDGGCSVSATRGTPGGSAWLSLLALGVVLRRNRRAPAR
jgi:MYXO-CTERM domain-containing protein